MKISEKRMEPKKIIILIAVAAAGLWPLKAYMMSSEHYQINWDSVNVGGANATSTSYENEDTIGEVATGNSSSDSYNLKAGYQQMAAASTVSISVVAGAEVSLSPNILAISGGTANGTGTVNVTTDNPDGYQLELKASAAPALTSDSGEFGDYTEASSPTPDYDWSIGSSASGFGFTVWGNDIAQAYLSAANQCNQSAGSADGTHCWSGFDGTSGLTVAQSSSANAPSGTDTSVKYRAQVKENGFQTPGSYSATITATATMN